MLRWSTPPTICSGVACAANSGIADSSDRRCHARPHAVAMNGLLIAGEWSVGARIDSDQEDITCTCNTAEVLAASERPAARIRTDGDERHLFDDAME
jgi:hypothetical protein